jgi:uncharacterized protein YecE (DUF72 family)
MIRIGIGGWVYQPWRGVFYPKKLPQARELEYASRELTSIEINGTFYSTQRATSFRRWADETPDDFVFALKAPRYATHRRVLAEAKSSIDRFFSSGLQELKSKLGPILWQFPPTKTFDGDDFAAFLSLLPKSLDGIALRHAVEVRHESFCAPAFVALLRQHAVAVATVDSEKHPLLVDLTSDFVYARLQRTSMKVKTGYSPADLDTWAARAHTWAKGSAPEDLPALVAPLPSDGARDVFIYLIAGAKLRAPAAAAALIERVKGERAG